MNTQKKSHRPGGPGPARWYQGTPDILLDDEIDLLLQEAIRHSLRDYTLFLFTLSTGLRNAEVLGLNIENIKPFGVITTILDLPGGIAKNNKQRLVPLNSDIRDALEKYINDEKHRKRIRGGRAPLFRSLRRNYRLGPRDFHQILRRHSITSINRPCNPHMLRHTFATKLLKQSNIKIVQEILGHNCLQSTQIYLHPSSSDMITAVDKLSFISGQK